MGHALGFAFYVLVQLVPARCLIPRWASLLPTGGHSLQHSGLTVSLGCQWACRPVVVRAPTMQTLQLLFPSCTHLLPSTTAKRLVTSND